MIFQSPGPEILNLGPITLRWYGLLIATGFYLALNYGAYLLKLRANKDFHSKEEFQNFAFFLLLGGVIGARIWYVILDWDYFSEHLLQAPQIWLGGISIQGGIIGACISAFIIYGKRIDKLLFYLSVAASGLPLAQAIGRWGNFFNEEAFGKVCDLPWKLYISHTGEYHHPTFLYESILNFGIFLILFAYNKVFYKNNSSSDLTLIGLYISLYSLIRFFLEAIRTDSLLIGGYPAAQLISIIGMALGVILILVVPKFVRR